MSLSNLGQSAARTTDVYHCEGCGTELAYNGRGRKPKWCSERCRKASYGDPCVDCGAKTRYGAETARVPEPHCDPCRARRNAARRCKRVMAMFALRNEGLTNKAISERLNIPRLTVAAELSRLSALGFAVAAAPYNRAQRSGAQIGPEARTLGNALEANGIGVPAFTKAAA